MSLDLEGFSPKELDALISKAQQRKKKLQKRPSIAAVRKALAEVARKNGYTLAEIFGPGAKAARAAGRGATKAKGGKAATKPGARKSPAKGKKVPAKYKHPATGQTWSGRGITPKWMAAEIAKGKKREDFAI